MGLCKCPKKRVTNLFCFVHRVNVCEDCMIRQHSRCIVHSYLQWLQDSDYEPVCLLCAKSLDEGDVIRLCCHDLFHVTCLDSYVQSRPTGVNLPAVKCPRCKDGLFPPPHMVSPVADQLRLILRKYWWGQEGLGIALVHDEVSFEDDEILTTSYDDRNVSHTLDLNSQMTSTPLSHPQKSHDTHVTLELYNHTVNRNLEHDGYHPVAMPTSGHHYRSEDGDYPSKSKVSPPEDKYKRKNPVVAMKRWFRSQQGLLMEDSSATIKRNLVIILLVCAAVVTLIVLMTRVGRRTDDDSDRYEWRFNPNIKTGQ